MFGICPQQGTLMYGRLVPDELRRFIARPLGRGGEARRSHPSFGGQALTRSPLWCFGPASSGGVNGRCRTFSIGSASPRAVSAGASVPARCPWRTRWAWSSITGTLERSQLTISLPVRPAVPVLVQRERRQPPALP